MRFRFRRVADTNAGDSQPLTPLHPGNDLPVTVLAFSSTMPALASKKERLAGFTPPAVSLTTTRAFPTQGCMNALLYAYPCCAAILFL